MTKQKTIKPLYTATNLKKTAKSNLWVAFTAGSKPSNGTVYGSTLTRDQVRNAYSKYANCTIQEVRARRVSNLDVRKLKNSK